MTVIIDLYDQNQPFLYCNHPHHFTHDTMSLFSFPVSLLGITKRRFQDMKNYFIAHKKVLIPVICVILVLAGIFIYSSVKASASSSTQYQTEAAKLGDVSVQIDGTGTVRANQSAVIYWKTDGKVGEVYVNEGQLVQEDQMVINLDPASLSQEIIQAMANLVTAKQDLEEAQDGSQAKAKAESALVDAQIAYNTALGNYWEKSQTYGSTDQIAKAEAQVTLLKEKVEKLEKQLNAMAELPEDSTKKAQKKSDLAQARIDLYNAKQNLAYLQATPDPVEVAQLQADLDVAKANLEAAQRAYDRVKDGPSEEDILTAQAKVAAAQATVDMAQLKAPFTGTVTLLNCQPGSVVSAGDLAYRIDDLSHLYIDVDVSEIDINQVKIGQPVTIQFDAITNKEYTGKVTKVAANGELVSGTINYSVEVEIIAPTSEIKLGMTAVTGIYVTQLKDVLLIPSRGVRTVDGKRVVYVLDGDALSMVEVTLGVSEGNYSQVVSGEIALGDLIVLNPPDSLTGMMSGGSSVRGAQ